ncbi:MAG: DUF4428 domain-containing protein [Hungatella sp.]
MRFFLKKSPCPICGAKISLFLPTKIGGQYICDACVGKIDVQEELKHTFTIPVLKEYMQFYKENQRLKDKFVISQKLDFGCFNAKIIFDFENHLFCMNKSPNKTIFEGVELKSFTIMEDSVLLFEGSKEGLVRYECVIPDRVYAFHLELYLEHPYWKEINCEIAIPDFSDDDPDADDYLSHDRDYIEWVEQLARGLMEVAFPETRE